MRSRRSLVPGFLGIVLLSACESARLPFESGMDPARNFRRRVDSRVKPPRPDLVANALVPDFALGNHTGSLGLTFYDGQLLPERRCR